jgi:hypothetical protein
MDGVDDLIIPLVELITLIVCVSAGIVFRAWWKAICVAILCALLPGFILLLLSEDKSFEGQAFIAVIYIDWLKFQLPAAVLVAALSSLASYFVRRRRTSKDVM